jgi:hypothetical protein
MVHPDSPDYDPDVDNTEEWVAKHDAAGNRVTGERLRPVEDARTVRRAEHPMARFGRWSCGRSGASETCR